MPKLEWDKTGERLYETGIDHGVLYPYASGNPGTGVAWNGLTSVTESPSGAESNPQYADNTKYLNLRSAEEFGGDIEAFTYPEEWAECDGSKSPSKGVYFGQQTRKMFGLSYRTKLGNDTEGDDYGYILHLVYGATASPSERQYQTINDSPEPVTFSWEFDTQAVAVDGYKPVAHIEINSKLVDAQKLAAFEKKLYGDTDTEPSLPLPAEVLTLFPSA